MSAYPAPPTSDERESLAILRRIEPVLVAIQGEQKRQGETLVKVQANVGRLQTDVGKFQDDLGALKVDVVKLQVEVAELGGRIRGLPTTWQMLTGIVAIVGSAFAMVKLSSH